ncbi:hypothetical protein Pcinc_028139 [Petrolisthes cinctipes]|uniref:Uncharacterized protein n=1 Tax=Petrolisthes cinctipes TaxID=88211 RepID=A0AAE1F2N7_PETCI|nr:hypothetical protein Pcinc_028139 [Petrolisthes cinctipes]
MEVTLVKNAAHQSLQCKVTLRSGHLEHGTMRRGKSVCGVVRLRATTTNQPTTAALAGGTHELPLQAARSPPGPITTPLFLPPSRQPASQGAATPWGK